METVTLSKDLIDDYNNNGAVLIRGVFSKKWIQLVRDGIAKNLESPSPFSEKLKVNDADGVYFNDYCNWREIPEFQTFVEMSPAACVAGQLMKSSKSVFYHEHVLIKEARASARTPWHHDQSYYPIDGKVCSLWMPLDPVSQETAVRFVKGSHAWNKWFYPRKFATSMNYNVTGPLGRLYETVPEDEIESGRWEILSWGCEPGDVVAFHGLTLHGAPGNLSFTQRRILSTRWVGEDAVFASRPWEVSPPMRVGLNPGQPVCSTQEFPILWENNMQSMSY